LPALNAAGVTFGAMSVSDHLMADGADRSGLYFEAVERSVFRLVDLADGALGIRRLLASVGGPQSALDAVREDHFVGTPDEVIAKVQRFVDAGARHLVLMFVDADHSEESATRFMADVVPGLDG
jgi:alkanesulfonate monooxygenase SsuD/methylene tetrahydromethanopterin reductase-like flavin-dependent oxidoreductase (luciferase family)